MRLLKIILALAVVLVVAGFAGFRYWQAQLDQALTIDAPVVYEVPSGAGFNQVVRDLAERGIIAETWSLRLLKRARATESASAEGRRVPARARHECARGAQATG